MYHVANGLALAEYLLGLYFRPSLKSFPYVSLLGESYKSFHESSSSMMSSVGVVVVLFGQFLRSAAMIKASSNFSHMVAFRKLTGHQLVTDGVYKFVISEFILSTLLTWSTGGQGTRRMQGFFIGR
jgi:protein-S-isoprenylcysteine O-methyltransferase